jgi:hypothetical protein
MMLVGFATLCLAQDNDKKDIRRDNGQGATVTKVDVKKNAVTLKMRAKNGKEEEQSFNLSNDARILDENGKAATLESLKEGEYVRIVEKEGKLAEIRQQLENEATITSVNPKEGRITVRMKDKGGKELEKTFTLTEDARIFDSTGKVVDLDLFRAGNYVLVVAEEGRITQIKQKNDKSKEPNK